MANITSFPALMSILGDGVSTTASVTFAPPPTAVALVNAFNSDGTDASGNIFSVGISGNNVVLTFNNPFTGLISVEVNITNGYFQTLPAISVLQATTPWVVTGATTISGPVAVTNAGTFAVQDASSEASLSTIAGAVSGGKVSVSNSGTFAVQASITTLGQQLAAASVPVVLTAAQLTTLTPLSTVAVTQSTSPWVISGAVTVASTTVTNTVSENLTQVGGVAFALGQQLAAASLPVVLTAAQLTALQTVSVSNFPATQPVSGTVAVSNFPASQVVTLASTTITGTVAVTQSTSPWVVSLASTTVTNTVAENLTQVGGATFALGQQLAAASLPIVLTAAQIATLTPLTTVTVTQATGTNLHTVVDSGTLTAVTAITNALPAGTNVIGHVINDASSAVIGHVITDTGSTVAVSNFPASQVVTLVSTTITGTVAVTAPTLTKDTQGANGFSVQALHDAGRNSRAFMLDAITVATATEALVSVVQWYGNAAVAGTTQPAVVPAGKTLRLTSWKIQHQAISNPGYAVVRLRVNTGGVAVLASPLAWSFEAGAGTAANTSNTLAGTVTTETGDFPEGFEIPAGSGVGFTLAGYGSTGTLTLDGGVRFAVFGYEY